MESLAHVAAQVLEPLELVLGFDAFGYDVHPEGVAQVDDARDDRRIRWVIGDAFDEGAVDFELVYGEAAEVAER